MGVMDKIMGVMMGRMSKGEKEEMMGKTMEKFFPGMTAEDKQKMMGMMPQCLKVMLPNMPKEKRVDFVLEMVTTLVEHGCTGMSDNEKEDFVAKLIEKVNT